jgi:ribosomal protein S18 acetylase RimI-like enzyme
VRIVEAQDGAAYAIARQLLAEYATWLDIEVENPILEHERNRLPADYGPPNGAILLAYVGDGIAGCVALRPLQPGICEMKRLWVREAFRRDGVGRALAVAVLERAARSGYQRMRLDTLAGMKAARRLYDSLGFREIPAYNASLIPDTLYLEIELKS